MAFAYIASIGMPYIFGLIADYITIDIMPIYLLFFSLISITMLEILSYKNKRRNLNE